MDTKGEDILTWPSATCITAVHAQGGHPSMNSSRALGLILKQSKQMNCAREMPLLSTDYSGVQAWWEQMQKSTLKTSEVTWDKSQAWSPLSALWHGKVLVFPSLCLEQASFVSWFLKYSHLINVTGLSVELCEWNIIVWAKKRVEGDELKVYPGLTCKETEPEPNVVCSC